MAKARTLTKQKRFAKRQTQVADFAKVLSHPARLSILMALAKKKDCVCGELVLDLPIAQSTVSQHLRVLQNMGLIKGRIEGVKSRYCIDWTQYQRLSVQLATWLDQLSRRQQHNTCL